MPDLVAVDRWLVAVGTELTVRFHAPGEPPCARPRQPGAEGNSDAS